MKKKDSDTMGRFAVDIEVTNNRDLENAESGFIDPTTIRRKTIRGIVDSGAARLVLPQKLAKELGLAVKKTKTKVRYADGRRSLRPEVGPVHLRLQGRDGVYTALVEPNRETALIGAIVLEDLDFLVDCLKSRLVPRDPDYVVSEIE